LKRYDSEVDAASKDVPEVQPTPTPAPTSSTIGPPVDVKELYQLLGTDDSVLIIDMRLPEEYRVWPGLLVNANRS
jgi:hypothetical protein